MASTVIDTAPYGRFHRKLYWVSAGGPFLDGYVLSIVGIVLPGIAADLDLSSAEEGLVGAAALVGLFVGGLFFGRLTDHLGRQLMYTIDLIALVVGSILCFFVDTAWQLILLRFILGIAVGADYPIATALLVEWLPLRERGRTMGKLMVAWFAGAAAASAVGYILILVLGEGAWPWALASAAVPGVLILLARLGTPESPRWLLAKGRREDARKALVRVLQREITDADLDLIAAGNASEVSGFRGLFRGQYLIRTAFVGLFWMFQIIPLFALYTFGPTILEAFSLATGPSSALGSVLINVVFLLGLFPALYLVDALGRRRLIVWSFALMVIPLAVLGVVPAAPVAVVVLCFCLYAFFSGGPSILEWLYPTELFPTEVRATAVGVGTAISRIGAATGTYLLPISLSSIGLGNTMLVGAGLTLLGFITCVLLAPETRGKPLDEASSVTSAASQAGGGRVMPSAGAVH